MSTKGSHKASFTTLILAALSIFSIYTTYLLYSLTRQIDTNSLSRWQGKLDVEAFTFVGDDFPDYLPIEMGYVRVERGKEWPPISMPFEEADGSYRIGPQNRTFTIAMFHELHCLDAIEDIIVREEYPPVDLRHLQHCFNFLRLWGLCEPDLTLESGDFVQQGPFRNLVASTRTCRNWDDLHQELVQNYRKWNDFKVMQGRNFTAWSASERSAATAGQLTVSGARPILRPIHPSPPPSSPATAAIARETFKSRTDVITLIIILPFLIITYRYPACARADLRPRRARPVPALSCRATPDLGAVATFTLV
ncbi:hypothetical protein EWM64_g5885 [Hericium alpestre]|uniref:Uncharacterized protein n=1 Tax=Hericium alpestre TaxID=135208 RepID=A0A4Y9ZU54_9AGAM|nr:hypothetical protein EWM64_g5885 [Hericium alpestre]